MKIKTEHEGKRGTITTHNGESALSGTVAMVNPWRGVFSFLAKGMNSAVVLDINDWEWTPEREPLPTKPGAVVRTPRGNLFFRRNSTYVSPWVNEVGDRYSDQDLNGTTIEFEILFEGADILFEGTDE